VEIFDCLRLVKYAKIIVMKKKTAAMLDKDALIEVIKNTPLVSIDLIVKDSGGRVLVGWRTNEPAMGFWFVPGGRILKDERLAEAFERVAKDELGAEVKIENARFLGVFEHLYDENFAKIDGFGTHYVVLGYEIRLDSPKLKLPNDQHSRYRWLTPEGILGSESVHPNTKAYFS